MLRVYTWSESRFTQWPSLPERTAQFPSYQARCAIDSCNP